MGDARRGRERPGHLTEQRNAADNRVDSLVLDGVADRLARRSRIGPDVDHDESVLVSRAAQVLLSHLHGLQEGVAQNSERPAPGHDHADPDDVVGGRRPSVLVEPRIGADREQERERCTERQPELPPRGSRPRPPRLDELVGIVGDEQTAVEHQDPAGFEPVDAEGRLGERRRQRSE